MIRTPAYQFTMDPLSGTDYEKLVAIKKAVASANHFANQEYKYAMERFEKGYGTKPTKPSLFRVSQKARLGKKSPFASFYKNRTTFRGYGNPFQSIKLEHAARIDVYIHRK